MSIRAEMRRQQREAEKRAAKTAKNIALLTGQNEDDIRPLVTPDMVANFPAGKIASLTGTKVETLNWWIKARAVWYEDMKAQIVPKKELKPDAQPQEEAAEGEEHD